MAPKTEMSAKEITHFAEDKVSGLNGHQRGLFVDALKRGAQKRRKDAMKLLAELDCDENLSLKRKRKLVADFTRLQEEAQRMEQRATDLAMVSVQFNLVTRSGKRKDEDDGGT